MRVKQQENIKTWYNIKNDNNEERGIDLGSLEDIYIYVSLYIYIYVSVKFFSL